MGAGDDAQTSRSQVVIRPPESFFEMVRERDRDVARQFYKKYIDVGGMPVVAAAEVADEALQRTHDIVTHMLAGRPDVLEAMVAKRHAPDHHRQGPGLHRHARVPATPRPGVSRTSGCAAPAAGSPASARRTCSTCPSTATTTRASPSTSSATPSTAALRRSTRRGRATARSLPQRDRQGPVEERLRRVEPGEYWAEICQSYFDCNRVNNWNHGPIGTREQLKLYDPEGYELVRTTFKLTPEQRLALQPGCRSSRASIAPPAKFKIDPYYTKFTWAREFTVLGRGGQRRGAAQGQRHDPQDVRLPPRHPQGDDRRRRSAGGAGPGEKISDLPEYRSFKEQGIDPLARFLDYSSARKPWSSARRTSWVIPMSRSSGPTR